eukprot:3614377-Rhodomonas_salina.1
MSLCEVISPSVRICDRAEVFNGRVLEAYSSSFSVFKAEKLVISNQPGTTTASRQVPRFQSACLPIQMSRSLHLV